MGLLPDHMNKKSKARMEDYLQNHLSNAEEVGFMLAGRGKPLKKSETITFRNNCPYVVKKGRKN